MADEAGHDALLRALKQGQADIDAGRMETYSPALLKELKESARKRAAKGERPNLKAKPALTGAITDSNLEAMSQLIVRRLEDAIVRRLRRRAAAEGVSVEEAHRRVLREALLGKAALARENFIAYLQAMPDVDLPVRRSRELPRQVEL